MELIPLDFGFNLRLSFFPQQKNSTGAFFKKIFLPFFSPCKLRFLLDLIPKV